MKFSQRMGKIQATKTIQIEDMDIELKNGLWNALKICFMDLLEKQNYYGRETKFLTFCKFLWLNFYKFPIDTISDNPYQNESYIRDRFFKFQWFEVYDFLEFIANLDFNIIPFDPVKLKGLCNSIFERENSAYRFIDDNIAPITNSSEIAEIEEAISTSGQFSALNGVNIIYACFL
jgi:hypothetical protein